MRWSVERLGMVTVVLWRSGATTPTQAARLQQWRGVQDARYTRPGVHGVAVALAGQAWVEQARERKKRVVESAPQEAQVY